MFDKLRSLMSSSSTSVSTDAESAERLFDEDPTGLLDAEPTGLFDDEEWFTTREVQASEDAQPATPDQPSTSPASPKVSPPPSEPLENINFPRGSFAVPESRAFLQNLETRAQNGAHEVVETAYVLTGPSYSLPNMMFQLDNTDYYTEATKTSLQSLTGKMAADVANAYQDRDPPKMLAWIHTHPNGGTTPSSKDRNGADTVRETFSRALGTNDFEFFNGIHAFDASWEQESTIEDQYNVTTDSNSASWIGTRFKHTLSMWDPTFTSPRQVEVVN